MECVLKTRRQLSGLRWGRDWGLPKRKQFDLQDEEASWRLKGAGRMFQAEGRAYAKVRMGKQDK
jgi:hypothetical protein